MPHIVDKYVLIDGKPRPQMLCGAVGAELAFYPYRLGRTNHPARIPGSSGTCKKCFKLRTRGT